MALRFADLETRELMKPLRGIPSSRAYWELKAEQMMNRIFDPEQIIDLEPREVSASSPPQPPHGRTATAPKPKSLRSTTSPPRSPLRPSGGATPSAPQRAHPLAKLRNAVSHDRQFPLVASLAGLSLVGALCSVLFLNHSWRVQETLREERNLLLVERLRSLGPASSASQPVVLPPQAPAATTVNAAPGADLPPPPEEPWIQELGNLPQRSSDQAPVLRVPLSPRLAAAAPPAVRPDSFGSSVRSAAAAGPAPQLVGLVGAQGRLGSAIFRVGGSSANVGLGESIGSSGWTLRAADSDSAVIERNGEVRRISLTNAP
jgi:hypothetical protein